MLIAKYWNTGIRIEKRMIKPSIATNNKTVFQNNFFNFFLLIFIIIVSIKWVKLKNQSPLLSTTDPNF